MDARHGAQRVAYVVVAVAVITAASIAIAAYFQQLLRPVPLGATTQQGTVSPSALNINASDVELVTGSQLYHAYALNNVTYANALPRSEGYRYVSSSVFVYAGVGSNTSYPADIVSLVYYMGNASATEAALNSTFFTNNADQNTTARQLRLPGGMAVDIYETTSIALYNSSIASAVISNMSRTANQLPVFDATSSFAYGDVVGSVTASGYEYSPNANVSMALAGLLLNRLYAANIGLSP